MLIKKLGEFGLINRFKKSIKTDSSVFKGSGDDCAVLRLGKFKYQLFTCDMLVAGIDFVPKENPYLIGRKALAVSLSDIAACSGIPRYAIVSMGLPSNTSVGYIDRLFKGFNDLAKRFRVNIVGGDISRSKELTIDVSLLGEVEKKKLVLRSGAKTRDIIFVSGSLGGSIKGKHLRFTPRLKEARLLTDNFKINSMIDISDGLAQDLGHIMEESRVGAVIYEDLIPLSKECKDLNDALYSGEDFELLFTLARKEASKILKKRLNIFTPIGEITGKDLSLRLVDKKNSDRLIKPKGYRHF